MENQQYDYKRLIDIYLATHIDETHPDGVYQSDSDDYNEALKSYYRNLLAALERLFGISFIDLSSDPTPFAILWRKTVASYRKISSPWSDFIEATLILRRLEQQGDTGQQVLTISDQIYKLSEQNSRLHREMLYQLFLCLCQGPEKVITSPELQVAGFDDTAKPDLSRY